jgi:hypothetical protein
MNTAQLCCVHKFFWRKIRGKDYKLIEQYGKFLPCVKRQVIHFTFEGKNPAIQ